jgi:hypothetical protein
MSLTNPVGTRPAAEYNAGNSSTALTVNFNNGGNQKVTLTGNCTFTFSNPVAGETYLKWPAATAPTLTTTASAIDIVSFYYDGTNYFGSSALAFG